jgi:hypothetical protein
VLFLYKTNFLSLFLGAFTLVLTSCESESISDPGSTARQNTPVTNSINVSDLTPCTYTELIAGQRYDAGDIKIYFDASNLYVEYQASINWRLRETHLFVGNQSMIPITRYGSANSALFPVSETFQGGSDIAIYSFPRAGLPKCFTIAAYAEVQRLQNGVVVQSEVAWGEGDRFHPSDWGMSFDVCQSDCSSN